MTAITGTHAAARAGMVGSSALLHVHVAEAGPMFPDRYVARLWIDGNETDWDCPHLHHTANAAEKCIVKHLAGCRYFRNKMTFTEKVIPAAPGQEAMMPLIEWRYQEGERTAVSRRFRFMP